MPPRDLNYLTDIIQAANEIQSFVRGVDKEQFDNSSLIQSAVIRQLEVIGEATKRLSDEFRNTHAGIPWKKMAGMRDIMIHAYDHVDMDEVWNAAITDIPALTSQIRLLVEKSN